MAGGARSTADSTDVAELRELLRQRDNEISILVSRLKKQRARESAADGRSSASARGFPERKLRNKILTHTQSHSVHNQVSMKIADNYFPYR